MIELPRACLVAGALASHADFFSFGTNDLAQTALGFSRDDIEARIVPLYADAAIAVGDRNYRRLRHRLDECDVRLEAARSMLRRGGYLTH